MAEQKQDQKNSTATATSAGTSNVVNEKEIPSLGALDEDDEFEEFEAQGRLDIMCDEYRKQ